MGWGAAFYFPSRTKRDDVEHFLSLIGYVKTSADDVLREMKATGLFAPKCQSFLDNLVAGFGPS